MTERHNRRVAELFEAVLREEPAHRSEFLRRACADDESLLIEVISLVDEDERLGNTTGASLKETASMTSLASFDVSGIRNIARYLVVRELGRGGMGVVLEARDPLIGRTVAIKTIRLDAFAGSPDTKSLQDSLLREARAAGALSHPGIVIVHDFGVYDNLTYIAMEYVDGPTLQRKLTIDGQIERKEAVDLLRQIAVALDYAHAAGVVHRDVKPGNIMLQRGTLVKITDFGIAKVSTTHQLIHTGTVVGTPAYMAPEQIRALPVGGRSDQFSLAVVAFEMLTGVRPFRAKSMPELVHQVVYGERPSARAANPALSPVADAVFYRGLANLPEDRYESCMEFVRGLEAALDGNVSPAKVRQPATHGQGIGPPRPVSTTESLINNPHDATRITTTGSGTPAAGARPISRSRLSSAMGYLMPSLAITLVVRWYLNTSSVTRDRPLGLGETIIVFMAAMLIASVIRWIIRVLKGRTS
jgi:serine/threonine protein kinase